MLWAKRSDRSVPVDDVAADVVDAGDAAIQADRPVVVDGLASRAGDWTVAKLLDAIGDVQVRNVFISEQSARFLYFKADRAGDTSPHLQRAPPMRFREFVERSQAACSTGRHYYLYGEPLPSALWRSLPDMERVLGSTAQLTSSLLWMALDATCSPLHYDMCHGLLLQMAGQKRFIMFPPDGIPDAYMHPVGHARMGLVSDDDRQSQINDICHPDLAAFPAFAGLRGTQGVVEPGQALVIPYGWMHQIEAGPGLSISVSTSVHAARTCGLPPAACAGIAGNLLHDAPSAVRDIYLRRMQW
ncbi:hypothetical protein PBRA_003235 [Plasmodiophora brassicae]|uniref:JmjC domain-containing protein n=1 Tax=Plasmodiophora brassicae TaxID=37360 RepID=A0A0G4J7B0_PLABS|nr:hypothetical protein PBRA_003235 [Plasmodiophora brassicae]